MQAPETELKFPVDNIAEFRASVTRAGFHLRTERTFESNTLYDTPGRDLRARRQILRLRDYGGTSVATHKRTLTPDQQDVQYKTRIETETVVEDGDALAEIFTQLGFAPVFRYEKFRTEWDAPEGGHLVLDETAIGVWAELEGDTSWIDATLGRLGIDPARCTTESYGMLFLNWKQKHNSPAENLTFEEIAHEAVG
jgi:adenylate cyclase class 2